MNAIAKLETKSLTILGATGGIGRQLVDLALAAGHRVTVLARDPSKVTPHPRLAIVQGDATDPEAVDRAVAGADAVLCALGAPALSRSRIRTEGTRHIVAAMERHNVARLIAVSVFGAAETREALPFFLRYFFFPLYLRRAVADHEAQERIIADSDLAWTVVRPPFLTDGDKTGRYALDFGSDIRGLTLDVSRADVADFMLRELEAPRHLHQQVGISYRKAA